MAEEKSVFQKLGDYARDILQEKAKEKSSEEKMKEYKGRNKVEASRFDRLKQIEENRKNKGYLIDKEGE
jgi:hypothetical protein